MTGSIVKETVNGRGGNDTFISVSNTQGDTFNGGTGNDEFLYLQGSPPVVDTLNGGTGSFDRIVIAGATSYDFRAATLSSIERFNFGAFDQVAQINASMLGSGGIIEIKGTASVNAMEIYGATNLDLGAAVNFTTWDSNLDTIRIEGTSGDDVITGTRKADVIIGLAGEDTLNGGRGNDVFEFAATTFGSLDGGIGIDALRVNSTSVFQISFENATLSGLEELVFDNISGTTAVEMDAAQVGGTGIATVWGSDAINQFTVQSSAASGYVANIDQILFQNWNRNFDTLGLLGTTGDDTLIGTSYRTISSFRMARTRSSAVTTTIPFPLTTTSQSRGSIGAAVAATIQCASIST